jgi:hypothetical protein
VSPWLSSLLGVTLHAVSPALAAEDIRKEAVHFDQGATSATIKGRIKGYEIDYVVRAKAGQTLAVTFKNSNRTACFNVLPPRSETALFVDSMDATGEHYEGTLPADGEYAIRVYQVRAAARRKESATHTLDVSVTGAAASSTSRPGLRCQDHISASSAIRPDARAARHRLSRQQPQQRSRQYAYDRPLGSRDR